MPQRMEGRLYAYDRRAQTLSEVMQSDPHDPHNDVMALDRLAARFAANPRSLTGLMRGQDELVFFAMPHELDGQPGRRIERLALLRHIRLLESIRDSLARRLRHRVPVDRVS